jgi:hypothetical protein
VEHQKFFVEPAGEALLILAAAALGWAIHEPLVFASLGPTTYMQIDKPHSKSSRPYAIIVGHLLGLGCGFVGIIVARAWNAPNVVSAGMVTPARLAAAFVAVLLTTIGTLLLKARQPAATATTLLVALGSMQTPRAAASIIGGVVLITILGEPLRRMRMKHKQPEEA